MRILHRQILKEIFSHGLLGLVLFTFVLFLRDSSRLLELLLRESANVSNVIYLFLLSFPALLDFTIPMAVLVGILITLSRMASDGELIALRAAGISVRIFFRPIALIAALGGALALYLAISMAPAANQRRSEIEKEIGFRQMSATLQPRVFNEDFPNLVLYVQDVISGENPVWKGIFLADLSNASGPKVTLAQQGILLSDASQNQLQLHLVRGNTHEVAPDSNEYSVATFSETDIPIKTPAPARSSIRPISQRSTSALHETPRSSPDWLESRIEFHRRLAIPLATLILALVGIPLGLSSHKGGKSMGIILTVLIVVAYYSLFIGGMSLARQGWLPPWAGVWLSNLLFAAGAVFLLTRVDKVAPLFAWVISLAELMEKIPTWFRSWRSRQLPSSVLAEGTRRNPGFPLILDRYVMKTFLFYLGVTLTALVVLTEVVGFFVDLLNDVIRNQIPAGMVLDYYVHLTPQLIYITTPLCVLLAILISFGVLTQHNEIIAIKASGVSLYRLSMPIFFLSVLLSAGLFLFDHFYIPAANRHQDAVRNRIKGRPAQTFYRPDRQWMFGQGSRIYYYKFFEPATRGSDAILDGVTVFDLDPKNFQINRRVSARRARWEASPPRWVFEDGWLREMRDGKVQDFQRFDVRVFPEIHEEPSYFLKEVKQSSQMNFVQLQAYLEELKQSGFDVVPLYVQLYRKFSFPLFAFIMALIGMPFAFSLGKKGALRGIAISIVIAIIYWGTNSLFEALGNLNELPAVAAAWSPNVVFALGGLYLFLNIQT